MCDEKGIEKENAVENKYLIVESKEGYEFVIEVDNMKETARITERNKKAKEKYKITYSSNGGSGTEIPSIKIRSGFSTILPNNSYTREDYIFVGWCEDKNGNGEKYLEGSSYTPKSNVTLYATWKYNVATINFDINCTDGKGSMPSKKVVQGDDTKLTANAFTREGYAFKEWRTNANGTGTRYADGEIINTETDITLYAVWDKLVTITFDGNGGSGNMAKIQVKKGEQFELPNNKFTKDNNTFKNWNTDINETGSSYEPGQLVSFANDVTLYTIWMPQMSIGSYVQYNVSYDDGYGSYDSRNGWRVLSLGETDSNGLSTGVRLVSTGYVLKLQMGRTLGTPPWLGSDEDVERLAEIPGAKTDYDFSNRLMSALYFHLLDLPVKDGGSAAGNNVLYYNRINR